MIQKKTLIVLISLIGFFSLLAYYEEYLQVKEMKASEKNQNIFELKLNNIKKIDFINKANKSYFSINKNENIFSLEENDKKHKASANQVLKFISSLNDLIYQKKIPYSIENQKAFKLDKAQKIIKFITNKNETITFALGDRSPIHNSYYVEVKEQQNIFLCPESVDYLMNKKAFDFREKKFINIDIDKLETLSIKNGTRILTLIEKRENKFLVIKPQRTVLSKSHMNILLENVVDIESTDIIEKNKDETFIQQFKEENAMTLYWRTTTHEEFTIYFALYDNQLFASYLPRAKIYKIPFTAAATINSNLQSF